MKEEKVERKRARLEPGEDEELAVRYYNHEYWTEEEEKVASGMTSKYRVEDFHVGQEVEVWWRTGWFPATIRRITKHGTFAVRWHVEQYETPGFAVQFVRPL